MGEGERRGYVVHVIVQGRLPWLRGRGEEVVGFSIYDACREGEI